MRPVVRIIEMVSVGTCWAATGLSVSWCALAYWLGWRRYMAVVDPLVEAIRWERDHCRASAKRAWK